MAVDWVPLCHSREEPKFMGLVIGSLGVITPSLLKSLFMFYQERVPIGLLCSKTTRLYLTKTHNLHSFISNQWPM